jgi:hypothetical protein
VVDVLAVAVVFVAGVIVGVIALVSVASRREDRSGRLGPGAPGPFTAAGRYLTRLSIRRRAIGPGPCDQPADPEVGLPGH